MNKLEWKALKALYGNGEPLTAEEVTQAQKLSKGHQREQQGESEAEAQRKLVAWMGKNKILHFHIPNGGKREQVEAYHLKMLGVIPGVPDLFIPVSRGTYFGLFVELKRENGGVVSSAQRWWIDRLNKEGYKAIVCHGFLKAKAAIEEYLNVTHQLD